MDAGIAELNELLAAATVLNGFEVDIFKDGEMSSRNDSELVGMVASFGRELASLAKVDFDGARTNRRQVSTARTSHERATLNRAKHSWVRSRWAALNRRGQNFQFYFGPN